MAQPILSINVTIEFLRDDEYIPYGCATDISIDKQVEVKEAKTLGDGHNTRGLPQSITRTISVSGVTQIDTAGFTAFDLNEHLEQFVEVGFRITFLDDDADPVKNKLIEGVALIIAANLGGGSSGHATGSFTLRVNGPIEERDTIETCDLVVTDFSAAFVAPGEGGDNSYDMTVVMTGAGSLLKFEYSIDGSGRLSGYGNPFNFTATSGEHSFTVWPICDDGSEGTSFTQDLTLT